MIYKICNTKLQGNWEDIAEHLPYFKCEDYDLSEAITACSIKGSGGSIADLYKSKIKDTPENYKYSFLYSIPKLRKLVDFFEFNTTRIRVFKQEPKTSTPMHIDKDASHIIRIWVALNDDNGFKFYFGKNKEEVNMKTGQILIFNPNKLHGAANLTSNKIRYTLNICGIPNEWLKNLMNNYNQEIVNV